MVKRRSRARHVVLLAALAVTGTACAQILGYSDRDVADGGVDGASPIGETGSHEDGGKHDSGKQDSGRHDTGAADTSRPEASTPDASIPDSSAPETGNPDTSTVDAKGETSTPDAKADTSAPDAKADTSTTADASKDAATDAGKDAGCTSGSQCPAQTTVCKTNVCIVGACGTADAPKGTACTDNGGRVCDGLGSCVACTAPTDCPATGNACVAPTCTANTCGTSDVVSGSPLAAGQTPGDCQLLVCNGTGGTMSVDDPADLPTSTSACKLAPACSGTPLAPTFVFAPSGTPCTDNGGTMCNATGMCT